MTEPLEDDRLPRPRVILDSLQRLLTAPTTVASLFGHMNGNCESGQFQRGDESSASDASIAMFGNTQQPIDVMAHTGHLFAPMPAIICDDRAFIDRLHCYLPGWEVPNMRNEFFTDNYGLVIDYLAEALRDLR